MLISLLVLALNAPSATEPSTAPARDSVSTEEKRGVRYELGVAVGLQLWRRAHGGLSSGPLVRIRGRRDMGDLFTLGEWIVLGPQVDYTRVEETTRALSVANHQAGIGFGAGGSRWLGMLRIDVVLDAGVLIEWSVIRDDAGGTTERSLRVQPQIGATAGCGFAVLDAFAVGLRAGTRWQPGRQHILLLFDFDWVARR